MPDKITAKTGNATIRKLGHTKQGNHGLNNTAQVKGRSTPTPQSAK
jgi:hypothetical protein